MGLLPLTSAVSGFHSWSSFLLLMMLVKNLIRESVWIPHEIFDLCPRHGSRVTLSAVLRETLRSGCPLPIPGTKGGMFDELCVP